MAELESGLILELSLAQACGGDSITKGIIILSGLWIRIHFMRMWIRIQQFF